MSDAAFTTRDGEFAYPVRVYFEDTDAGGVVYHANYLRFAERARTELIRGLGFAHPELMQKEGAAFAVRQCSADYLRPAHLDDLLTVHTRLTDIGGATLTATQVVRRDGEDLVRLDVRLAYMTAAGRPKRLPRAIREALEEVRTLGEPA